MSAKGLRVLITGGGGFLGSHLADAFLARGDEVYVLDTGSDAKVAHNLANPRFHFVAASIFERDMLESRPVLSLPHDVATHAYSALAQ